MLEKLTNMKKSIIITRKIQIYVNESDKEQKKYYYDQLFSWLRITHKAANLISTHLFTQDNIKDFIYLSEDVKVKLADQEKDPDGILKTSSQNTCYQMLSLKFKGDIPMDILSNINQTITKTYKEERVEYYSGKRSLRSYRNSVGLPFSQRGVTLSSDDKSFVFSFFNIPIKMRLGRDLSDNKAIVERVISGEYEMRSSTIIYKKNKWFLLLVVKMPQIRIKQIEGKELNVVMDIETPMIATVGKHKVVIGSKDEFLYGRIRIQAKLHKLQIALRYTKGGKGRKGKLQAIERFEKKESNYVKTKMHVYSHKLIQIAKSNKVAVINLIGQTEKEQEAKENEFLLRNWSYYGLKELISYKAKLFDIAVVVK